MFSTCHDYSIWIILPAKQGCFSLCKAVVKTATFRQIIGLLNGGQPDKDFFYIRPYGFQKFLQIQSDAIHIQSHFLRLLI